MLRWWKLWSHFFWAGKFLFTQPHHFSITNFTLPSQCNRWVPDASTTAELFSSYTSEKDCSLLKLEWVCPGRKEIKSEADQDADQEDQKYLIGFLFINLFLNYQISQGWREIWFWFLGWIQQSFCGWGCQGSRWTSGQAIGSWCSQQSSPRKCQEEDHISGWHPVLDEEAQEAGPAGWS